MLLKLLVPLEVKRCMVSHGPPGRSEVVKLVRGEERQECGGWGLNATGNIFYFPRVNIKIYIPLTKLTQ